MMVWNSAKFVLLSTALALSLAPIHGFATVSSRRTLRTAARSTTARGSSKGGESIRVLNEDGSITTPEGRADVIGSTTGSGGMEVSQRQKKLIFPETITQPLLQSYWGPRALLAIVPAIYGTNFALGSLMDASLPAAEVTALRMTLAATALLPWLVQVESKLLPRAILAGSCTALGYVSQSLALVDTDPARVSFLGAAMVLWCPILELLFEGRDLRWHAAPQTWMSAILCLLGVGVLEGVGAAGGTGIAAGDGLALLQAIGFGTQCFLCSKLIQERPSQVLPITAVLIATTAILSWIWCGFTLQPDAVVGIPMLLSNDPIMIPVLGALLWTGFVSTSGCFAVEVAALGRVPSSEASVLLATEPIWAAIFASAWLGESLTGSDYTGGALMIAACLVNAVRPADVQKLLAPVLPTVPHDE